MHSLIHIEIRNILKGKKQERKVESRELCKTLKQASSLGLNTEGKR